MDEHNVVILQNLRSYDATSLIHGLFVCYKVCTVSCIGLKRVTLK